MGTASLPNFYGESFKLDLRSEWRPLADGPMGCSGGASHIDFFGAGGVLVLGARSLETFDDQWRLPAGTAEAEGAC